MKIIIVGMSSIGSFLVKILSNNVDYDITIIDNDKEKVDKFTDLYCVNGVFGSGSSKDILKNAGVMSTDIIIALTGSDELNIMCSMIAKDLGCRYSAALIHRPELVSDMEYYKAIGKIDFVLNPRMATALDIELQIGLPGKIKTEAIFENNAIMLKYKIDYDSVLNNKSLIEIKKYFNMQMLVVCVKRNDKLFIPDGKFILIENDEIEIITQKTLVKELIEKLNLPKPADDNILVIGCGTTGYYLVNNLLKRKKNVKIIENDMERCKKLSELFPSIDISYVNDEDLLLKNDMKNIQVCICLTGDDSKNLINSLYAWSCGINSIITRIKSLQYEKLLNENDIQITISPIIVSAECILSFIRNISCRVSGENSINQLKLIESGRAEAIEFKALDNLKHLNIPFSSKEFRIDKNVLIAAIIRDGNVIIPDGNSTIQLNDRVIVVTKSGSYFSNLNDIFK